MVARKYLIRQTLCFISSQVLVSLEQAFVQDCETLSVWQKKKDVSLGTSEVILFFNIAILHCVHLVALTSDV